MRLAFIWLVLSTFELGTYMAANTANVTSADQALDLNNIRSVLQRMEDSIIFSLIERSQYRVNNAVYEPNYKPLGRFKLHQLKSSGSNGCLGDWFIYQTECLHSQVKRYEHPTEFSFFKPLPEPSLGQTISEASPTSSRGEDGSVLAPVPPEAVVNSKLLEIYRTKMIPSLCEEGDDGNYGSTAVQDVHVLQTISTRIYYGLFVAESKFRSEREKATELIKARDEDGLTAFITKPEVEKRNVQRVILKAKAFSRNIGGQADEGNGDNTTYKVNPEYIGALAADSQARQT
ncbi:CM1 [Symbiodinium sp. CCMP2592]|nr:CM1 [Symbiodinium sp. CCMP2592]